MLTRISNALIKFISPIVTSAGSQTDSDNSRNSQDFQPFQKKELPSPPSSSATPPVPEDFTPHPSQSTTPPSPAQQQKEKPTHSSFLQLVSLFQKDPGQSTQSKALKVYKSTSRTLNKAKKFKKGAMFDEDA